MSKITNPLQFLLGGRASFNLVNATTGEKVTYYVSLSKCKNYYAVDTLGKDGSKVYIGLIRHKRLFLKTRDEAIAAQFHKAIKGMRWLLGKLVSKETIEGMEMYHLGLCARCGRELSDLESIERGFGPSCWAKQ